MAGVACDIAEPADCTLRPIRMPPASPTGVACAESLTPNISIVFAGDGNDVWVAVDSPPITEAGAPTDIAVKASTGSESGLAKGSNGVLAGAGIPRLESKGLEPAARMSSMLNPVPT